MNTYIVAKFTNNGDHPWEFDRENLLIFSELNEAFDFYIENYCGLDISQDEKDFYLRELTQDGFTGDVDYCLLDVNTISGFSGANWLKSQLKSTIRELRLKKLLDEPK